MSSEREKLINKGERDQRRESEVREDRKGESEQWCQTTEHWFSDGCCPLTIRAFEGGGEEVLHVGSARARTGLCQPPPQRQMTEPPHLQVCAEGIYTAQEHTHSYSQYGAGGSLSDAQTTLEAALEGKLSFQDCTDFYFKIFLIRMKI